MKYKNVSLFLVVCFLTGVGILVGSVVGHTLGGIGLFLGAIVGGSVGVLVSTWLATRLKIIERSTYRAVAVSALAGFVLASVIAVANLHTPIIPLLSISLVGLAAVLANNYISRIKVAKLNTGLALIGLVLSAPALFFVSVSLLKFGFGVDQPFNLLEGILSNPDQFHLFNVISPFIFVGGLLVAVLLNLYPQLEMQLRRDQRKLVATITAEASPINLVVVMLGCLLLLILFGYVALENLANV
jgi:uncharacterized membrane protein YidH (DUF202 family)